MEAPEDIGDGWDTATPEAVGLDPVRLHALLKHIRRAHDHRIHSLLIVRQEKLILEEYWPGTDLVPATLAPVEREFGPETLHYVASVSKSITSALAGIALDQGLLASVDEEIFLFFPEHQDLRSSESEGIVVRNLLSFTSGYEWNEHVFGFDDPRDSHNQMFASPDPIRYLLGRESVAAPGAEFHYNSGDTNLLGEIIRRASGAATLVDFAQEHLFGPLSIMHHQWLRFRSAPQVTFASGGASLKPRDMAKLGALYLNRGIWKGNRILSQAWVEESTRMAVPLVGDYGTLYGYGFNWWLGRFQFRGASVDYFRAAGWGGQDIFVIPELDLVVVFTAGAYYESQPLGPARMIQDYILGAIRE
jgi:CubicO group peptidase (beta-lactamase class C family)